MLRRVLFIAAMLLCMLALFSWSSVGGALGRKAFASVTDPAIERANRDHPDAFGAIDRWAVPGMRLEQARHALEQRGWRCRLPEDASGKAPREGEHDARCETAAGAAWPGSVTLRVRYLPGQPPRLVSAQAQGAAQGGKELARAVLHKIDFAPPAALQVRGWAPTEPRALAELLFDRTVQGGWWEVCGGYGVQPGDHECARRLTYRHQTGFAAWPAGQPLVPGHVCSYANALGELGFLPERSAPPPAEGREGNWAERAQLAAEDTPGGWRAVQRWVGRDLAGTPWRAALHVAPEGGAVQRITLAVGGAEQSFAVAPGADRMGCNGTAARPQLVRLAPQEGTPDIGWMYWNADTDPESVFKWYAPHWARALPAERERLFGLMLDQLTRGAPRAATPRIGDMVAALYQTRPLVGQPEAWLEPEALERLHPRATRQPLLPVALLMMRCGAFEAAHGSNPLPPDRACWRELEARAPSVTASARQWLTALMADPNAKIVYDSERRLHDWMRMALLGLA